MCAVNPQCRVHQCYKCSEDTEYYCESCSYGLCPSCKENHVYDLNTVDHQIVTYLRKVNCYPIVETCVRHHNVPYERYCQLCKLLICCHCTKHRKHKLQDERTAYEATLQQVRKVVDVIRSETLINRCFCLNQMKDRIKEWHTSSSFAHLDMLTRASKLNNRINRALKKVDYKHSCSRQILLMTRHLARLENYEHIYERSATTPVHFFLSIKKTKCHRLYLERNTNQMFLTELIRKEDAINCIIKINKTDTRKRYEEKFLKLMSFTKLQRSISLAQVHCCHISLVTSDLVWVSDNYDLFLSNTSTGNMLYRIDDLNSELFWGYGFHTVSSDGNLFYINMNFSINKLSTDLKTKTQFIENTDIILKPNCVYCSKLTGDLLVGNGGINPLTGMDGNVIRYNEIGELIQVIQYDNRGQDLFSKPCYITENNNGDVVVSDNVAIVVTEREGGHRFSYTGHLSETIFWPEGICTDALSHILVCDKNTNTVQMLDRDGQFLSCLLIRPSGIFSPVSLCYDATTHRPLVGSSLNYKVCIYRYITREIGLFGKYTFSLFINTKKLYI